MKQIEIPFWNKYVMSVEEAAQYFNIGENKLRKIISDHPDAEYLLWIGTRVRIKRTLFEKYVDTLETIWHLPIVRGILNHVLGMSRFIGCVFLKGDHMAEIKRRDNKGRILRTGETQNESGLYSYRYTDRAGKRHEITSWKLTHNDTNPPGKKIKKSLREMEKEIEVELNRGLFLGDMTVLELVERYISTKTNVTRNTKAGYKTVYNILKKEEFAKRQMNSVRY